MSNLRQRIEAKERAEIEAKLDYVPRATQTAQQQAGAVSSTRSREERRAFETAPEEVVRPEARGGLIEAATYNTSVRDRVSIESAQREIDNPIQPTPNASAAGWATMYEQEQQWKRDEEKRNQDQIRRNAEAQRLEVQGREDRAKMFQVDLALSNASQQEVKTVKTILARKYPNGATYDQASVVLLKVREAGILGTPNWSK